MNVTTKCTGWLLFGLLLGSVSTGPVWAQPQVETGKPFLGDRERGWFWYEEAPLPPAKPKPPKEPRGSAGSASAKPVEVKQYEQFKAGMEEARIVAMFNPTQANVERYVQYRTALVKIADQLAEAGQRVVWANPEYDFTQARPVSAAGLRVHDAQQAELRRQTFERLARTHVLWFFFKSDCPYCHAFAPILKGFSQATGIKILPISLDGEGLTEFPNPRRDQGQAATLGATNVPALYLANPATHEVSPVAFGLQSEMELMDRVMAVANPGLSDFVDASTPIRPLEGFAP
jgi:conjugal transfer pilus assembly protein TraF